MIVYETDAAQIRADQRTGFFVGWPHPPTPDTALCILQGNYHVTLARDGATGTVVALPTAIADGVIAAYIPLVEVLPTWQHRGIGTRLLTRRREAPDSVYMVHLVADACGAVLCTIQLHGRHRPFRPPLSAPDGPTGSDGSLIRALRSGRVSPPVGRDARAWFARPRPRGGSSD